MKKYISEEETILLINDDVLDIFMLNYKKMDGQLFATITNPSPPSEYYNYEDLQNTIEPSVFYVGEQVHIYKTNNNEVNIYIPTTYITVVNRTITYFVIPNSTDDKTESNIHNFMGETFDMNKFKLAMEYSAL